MPYKGSWKWLIPLRMHTLSMNSEALKVGPLMPLKRMLRMLIIQILRIWTILEIHNRLLISFSTTLTELMLILITGLLMWALKFMIQGWLFIGTNWHTLPSSNISCHCWTRTRFTTSEGQSLFTYTMWLSCEPG